MTSHLFGGIWCSSSLSYALRRTIQDSDNVHPLVKDTVENSFYVDDYLKSVAQREQAEVIIKVIHKEYSRFLNQLFPTPCLYYELNMIIHTSYINI